MAKGKKTAETGVLKKLAQLSTTVKVLVPILSVFTVVTGAVLWLFSTFATVSFVEAGDKLIAGQVEDIKKTVEKQGNEVKIFILEGRREELVKERVSLESKKARSQSETERIGVLKEQIARIDRQLEALEKQNDRR